MTSPNWVAPVDSPDPSFENHLPNPVDRLEDTSMLNRLFHWGKRSTPCSNAAYCFPFSEKR